MTSAIHADSRSAELQSLDRLVGARRYAAVRKMAKSVVYNLVNSTDHAMAFDDLAMTVEEETGFERSDLWYAIDYGRHKGFLFDNVLKGTINLIEIPSDEELEQD